MPAVLRAVRVATLVSTCSRMALIVLYCCTRTTATSGRVAWMALKKVSLSARVGVSPVSVRALKLFTVAGGEFSAIMITASRKELTRCLPLVTISQKTTSPGSERRIGLPSPLDGSLNWPGGLSGAGEGGGVWSRAMPGVNSSVGEPSECRRQCSAEGGSFLILLVFWGLH